MGLFTDIGIVSRVLSDLPQVEQCVEDGLKAVADGKATLGDVQNFLTSLKGVIDTAQGRQDAAQPAQAPVLDQSEAVRQPTSAPVTADALNAEELAQLKALTASVPWYQPPTQ